MSRNRIVTVVGLAVIAIALFASACVSEQETRRAAEDARKTLEPVRDALAQRQAELADELEDPQADPEQISEAESELEEVERQLAIATKSLETAIAIEADPSDDNLITQAIGVVMPFVPEPYRLPVVLGGGLIASAIRQWKLRQAGREIARGVQVAAESDAELKKRIHENAGTIRLHQGATARRMVDEAQGKKPARLL